MSNSDDGTPAALVGYREAARMLGISPRTLEEWVGRREVPFYRIGRLVRFSVPELGDWVESRRIGEDPS
jgi:excisionase family DNA binding protein